MKYITVILVVLALATGCQSTQDSTYDCENLNVTGEYLFEGPNTLQGTPESVIKDLTDQLEINETDIQSVYVDQATIRFSPDSLQNNIESALVQWVSDELELVSVATKSPLPDNSIIELEVNKEQDILPYLLDDNSTLVVDVNILGDMDYLEARLDFTFNVEYSN